MHTIKNLWDDAHAARLGEQELLLYRSNLLGTDLRITNFGGGNTSAKLPGNDPLSGAEVPVLWVKGSGGDLASMKLDGFATLYLQKLEQLKTLYRDLAHEDEMVGYLAHCTFALNTRAAWPVKHNDTQADDALLEVISSENATPGPSATAHANAPTPTPTSPRKDPPPSPIITATAPPPTPSATAIVSTPTPIPPAPVPPASLPALAVRDILAAAPDGIAMRGKDQCFGQPIIDHCGALELDAMIQIPGRYHHAATQPRR